MKKRLSVIIAVLACAFSGSLFFLMPQQAQIMPDKTVKITEEDKQGDPTSIIDGGFAEVKSGTIKSHRAKSKTSSKILTNPPNMEEDEEEEGHHIIYSWDDVPGENAAPTNLPTSPDESLLSKNGNVFTAPGDMQYFRSHDMTAAEAPNRSVISEPSVVNVGSGIFYTANWYAAKSLDGGQSFTFVNPNIFPPVNGEFCCDQVTAYAPAQDMVLWGLQYKKDTSTNTFRIARTIGVSGLSSNQWIYWNFTPQDFGLASGLWLDFPNISVSGFYLYATSNIYTVSGDNPSGSVVWRISLAQLAAGGSINYSYNIYPSLQSLRLTEGAGATMHWVSMLPGGASPMVRLFHWADSGTQITFQDVVLNSFNPLNQDGFAPSPDGTNWAGHADSRILAAYVANGVIGAMWGAKQGGSFPYPYTIHARFNESSGAVISQTPIWNTTFAYLYPTASVNAAGNLGGAIAYGGGSNYPNAAIWALDDIQNTLPLGGIYSALTGTNGPSANKWGDYLTVKPHKQYPNSWVAGIYCLAGGQGDANAVSRYFWFGRERDGPRTFPGTGTGAIPDGLSGTPPQYGTPLVITFTVAGITGPLTDISTDVTLTHTWVGDVDMILRSPGGTVIFITASRIGVTTVGGFGDSSNYGGTYTFTDSAPGTNIWTVAAGLPDASAVTPGSYRTTAGGVPGQVNPAPVTNLTAAFAGLTTAQINGTWTLTLRDAAAGEIGTVTAANLILTGGASPTPTPTPSPSPSLVTVSGRALTSNFAGLRNAMISMTNSQNVVRTTTTSSFGFFSFANVLTGGQYIFRVHSRSYRYSPQTVIVNSDLTLPDFVGLE